LGEYKDIVKSIKFVIESCKRHAEDGTLLRKEIINIWSKLSFSLNFYVQQLKIGYQGVKHSKIEKIHQDEDQKEEENIEVEEDNLSDINSDWSGSDNEENHHKPQNSYSIDQNIEDHELMLKKKYEAKEALLKELKLDYPIEKKKKLNEQINLVRDSSFIDSLE
jgi:hypothetical protein